MDIRKIEKAEHPPRSGLWMELFRELVAFPLYLTAIWALWVFGRRAGVETLIVTAVGAVAIAFGFWLLAAESAQQWMEAKPAPATDSCGLGTSAIDPLARTDQN